MGHQNIGNKNISGLLLDFGQGSKQAYDELFLLVYSQLRDIAGNQLSRQPVNGYLQKTELVDEAYLKLIEQSHTDWQDLAHFIAAAKKAMRHILVDHYRRQNAQKRGGEHRDIPLDEARILVVNHSDKPIDLHESMKKLARMDKRMYEIVDLRFFGSMTISEIADLLHVSTSTVDRDWAKARGWLYRQLA